MIALRLAAEKSPDCADAASGHNTNTDAVADATPPTTFRKFKT